MGGGEDFKRDLNEKQTPIYRIDYAERLQAIERTQRDVDQRLQRIQTDQRELADRVQAVQWGQEEYDELLHDHQNVQKDLDRRVTSIDSRVREMDTKSHPLETLGNLKSLDDRLERIDARISSLDHRLNGHMNSERARKKSKDDALEQVQSLATEVQRLKQSVSSLGQEFRDERNARVAPCEKDAEQAGAPAGEARGDHVAEILAEGLVSVTQTLQSELDTTRLLLLTQRSPKRRRGWGGKPQWGDLPREEEESV